MPYARNDGARLAYELDGPSGAETVTFVEGLSYGTWMWNWQREALTEYRTLVWDNRGTGDSDEPEGPYTVADMAADLEAVLDDAGVERTHLVGASLGGMIAQRYALDYDRAESLALLCTMHGGDEAVPIPEETQERMLNVPGEYGPAETIRYKMRPAFTEAFWAEHPEVVDSIVDWRLDTDPSDRAYQWQSGAAVTFDASDRLDEIDLPTLVLHGTDDRVLPVENGRLLSDGIPGAEFAEVEDGGHLFFIERADRVNDALREFLTDA
ncbi:alpha/beta fold hydrolase [Halosimplex salinum]|uniref:alpha/beta fold hydrolase n=1 Tax=Halosimplex salinum TaxID=1710538 RepID=UPI000F46B008|nr:alpha/beta fold hydrolase [Halosimplex salinum]